MTGRAAKTVRADAHRNRERLVEAARRSFSQAGGKVPLEAVAREAGVGIGTLYRHFPTREALVEAVYRAELRRLCESAAELLEREEPARALRSWMDRFADYVATKQHMAEALRALIAAGTVTVSQARAELSEAVRTLLDAGSAAGALRGDVRAEDVVACVVGVFVTCDASDPEQAGRMLDLLLDGLRPRPA